MKITLRALRRRAIDRLLIESVDLSLYIAHAELDGERRLIVNGEGKPLKTRNLIEMKTLLAPLRATERVLMQRSSYDEMVGQNFAPADNTMHITLGEGYENLPPWQH